MSSRTSAPTPMSISRVFSAQTLGTPVRPWHGMTTERKSGRRILGRYGAWAGHRGKMAKWQNGGCAQGRSSRGARSYGKATILPPEAAGWHGGTTLPRRSAGPRGTHALQRGRGCSGQPACGTNTSDSPPSASGPGPRSRSGGRPPTTVHVPPHFQGPPSAAPSYCAKPRANL
jgi:hypothetical protein